jgi:hypothetical protein
MQVVVFCRGTHIHRVVVFCRGYTHVSSTRECPRSVWNTSVALEVIRSIKLEEHHKASREAEAARIELEYFAGV